MCKKDNKAVMPGGQEYSNVNVGLLNMSSEEMGGNLSAETVVTYIIAAICLFMCFKLSDFLIQNCFKGFKEPRFFCGGSCVKLKGTLLHMYMEKEIVTVYLA